MSATPRTDDAVADFHELPLSMALALEKQFVYADFARQLETELAAEKALTDKLLHDPNYVGGVLHWVQKHDALMLQLAESRAEVERLTKGLAQLPETSADELERRGLVVIAKSELQRLREDKARLDWLEENACFIAVGLRDIDADRVSIDAARKGTP
jgi:hypothetical protein